MKYKVDLQDHKDLDAVEIPSAVGMIGIFVPALVQPGCGSNSAEFDYPKSVFEGRVKSGQFRPQ